VVTRARRVGDNRYKELKRELTYDIVLGAGERGIKRMYGARVISKVYTHSDLGSIGEKEISINGTIIYRENIDVV
jgi:hypothetical protein